MKLETNKIYCGVEGLQEQIQEFISKPNIDILFVKQSESGHGYLSDQRRNTPGSANAELMRVKEYCLTISVWYQDRNDKPEATPVPV